MPEKYNFSACYRLLNTNPKTFQGWLKKANIDPNKQVNPADPRQKYLTRKQILDLAEEHGRVVSLLNEDEEKAASVMTIESLAEQIATNHALLTEQIATNHALLTEMTHSFHQILSLQQEQVDHRQQFAPLRPPHVEHAMEPTSDRVSTPSIRAEGLTIPSTPSSKPDECCNEGKNKSTASRSTKKAKSKGKSLPRTLVPLRVFADQHQIEMKVAERASESGKITVVRGKWLYDSRIVAKALNVGGQRSFYEYFFTQEGFTRCEQCPHGTQDVNLGTKQAASA